MPLGYCAVIETYCRSAGLTASSMYEKEASGPSLKSFYGWFS